MISARKRFVKEKKQTILISEFKPNQFIITAVILSSDLRRKHSRHLREQKDTKDNLLQLCLYKLSL